MTDERVVNFKEQMMVCLQLQKVNCFELQKTLKLATPNAAGMTIYKDIEKMQRQVDRIINELSGLIL